MAAYHDDPPAARNGKGPRGRCVATYDYRGADGVLTLTKRRFESKAFEWGRMRDGLWIVGANGAEPPLYRADELAKADPSATLWFCEGEKDADRLRSIGLLATSSPHGAHVDGKRWEPAYSRAVRRFDRVVVLEDNDDAGREHAAAVASAIHAIGIDVRVLRFPDLPEKGDVSDWLDGGRGAGDLDELAERAPRWEPSAAAEGRPAPTPLSSVAELPDFPAHLLPGWLRAEVEGVAAETETPVALAAMLGLSVLATCVQRRVTTHVAGDWHEPLSIFTVCVGSPSSGKSPVLKLMAEPVRGFEREERLRMAGAIDAAAARRQVLEARLEGLRAAARKEGAERAGDAEAAIRELRECPIPRPPRVLAGDITPERLASLTAEHGCRMGALSAEGTILKIAAGRHSGDQLPRLEYFNMAWSGEDYTRDRQGDREEVHLVRPALSLGLFVQPVVMRGMSRHPELMQEGFLSRFLFGVPSFPRRRIVGVPTVPESVKREYASLVRGLLAMRGAPVGDGDLPNVMEMSREATAALTDFRVALVSRAEEGGDLEHLEGWAGKLTSNAIRIASLLHIAANVHEPEPWRAPVTGDAMRAAVGIAEVFLIPHAKAAFDMMGADPDVELAKEILRWLGRKPWVETFTRRDVHNDLRAGNRKPSDFDKALEILCDHGWAWPLPAEPGKRGPKTTVYRAHPDAPEAGRRP